MPPQGLMNFPGIQQIVSGTFTLSHGITPSAALIQIVPQFGVVADVGTLSITFDAVTVDFPDSVIDSASLRRTEGGLIWSLRILDRRWKWRYREINGWFNRRVADGTLDANLEKTPRELATLCLQAMGESNFDVSELPDQTRPEVNWVYANPANELAAICDALGCRVVLGIDNSVRVRRKGVGAALPVPSRITDGFGIDPPEKPDSIKVVGTRVYQSKFRLEAVGKETDGTIKKINDLSYTPKSGGNDPTWQKDFPPEFANVLKEFGEDSHKLAVETVFRWYRIEGFLDGTGVTTTLPGETITLDRWNVLPLGNGLVSTYTDPDGNKFNNPPIVSGDFYDGRISHANVTDTKMDVGWTIDDQQGIVIFSRPQYKFDQGPPRVFAEADLILEITHPVKDPTTRQDLRYERERTLSGSSFDAGSFIIRRDEIVETRKANYSTANALTGVTTNTPDVDAEADSHIDAAEVEFQTVESQDIEYAGIVPIQPDGAIQQVSWVVGLRGAFTRASTNSEFDHAIPSYARRREIEEQREAMKKQRGRSRSVEAAG